jgi:hypothetical protein
MTVMPCPTLSDPINPTPDDLRLWAYTPEADYPDEMSQDWDLVITDFARAPLFLQFASDTACPNRKFFLRCLYILAGDCVRTSGGHTGIPHLREVLQLVVPDAPRDIHLWVERTEHLLAHPKSYNYTRWGWGDLAYDDRGHG